MLSQQTQALTPQQEVRPGTDCGCQAGASPGLFCPGVMGTAPKGFCLFFCNLVRGPLWTMMWEQGTCPPPRGVKVAAPTVLGCVVGSTGVPLMLSCHPLQRGQLVPSPEPPVSSPRAGQG